MIWVILGPLIYIVGIPLSALAIGWLDQGNTEPPKDRENFGTGAAFVWPILIPALIIVGLGWGAAELGKRLAANTIRPLYRASYRYNRRRLGKEE